MRIVDRLLAKGLPRALHHAAMHLACDQRVIEHVAEVIDGDVFFNGGRAGFRIDFDFGDVAAVGVGRADQRFGDAVERVGLGCAERGCQFHESDRAVARVVTAFCVAKFVFSATEFLRGVRLCDGYQFLAKQVKHAAGAERAA